ncbi:hypothetical protein BRD01_12190 [Halobacteriales archaeon QS_8_65_32]|nr:MAG: hypothetical protein BRD01_12190 [Halobacteriales archaeon QS_8_65_32]
MGVTDAAPVDLVALVEGETNRLSGSDRGVEMCLDCLEHEFVSASDLLDTALRNVLEAVAGDRNATESPGDDDATDHRRADSMDPGGNDETDGSDATTDPDGSDGGDAAAGRVPASVSASVSVSVSRLTVDGEEYVEVLIECRTRPVTRAIDRRGVGRPDRPRTRRAGDGRLDTAPTRRSRRGPPGAVGSRNRRGRHYGFGAGTRTGIAAGRCRRRSPRRARTGRRLDGRGTVERAGRRPKSESATGDE